VTAAGEAAPTEGVAIRDLPLKRLNGQGDGLGNFEGAVIMAR
jgi:hypothetical protein